MPSPQQEIFTAIRGICTKLGYTVYDYLPPDGVAYPFVFVGEQYSNDQANKSAVFGTVNQTVHILPQRLQKTWHDNNDDGCHQNGDTEAKKHAAFLCEGAEHGRSNLDGQHNRYTAFAWRD